MKDKNLVVGVGTYDLGETKKLTIDPSWSSEDMHDAIDELFGYHLAEPVVFYCDSHDLGVEEMSWAEIILLAEYMDDNEDFDDYIFQLVLKECDGDIGQAISAFNNGEIIQFEDKNAALYAYCPQAEEVENMGFLYIDWNQIERDMGVEWDILDEGHLRSYWVYCH